VARAGVALGVLVDGVGKYGPGPAAWPAPREVRAKARHVFVGNWSRLMTRTRSQKGGRRSRLCNQCATQQSQENQAERLHACPYVMF